jgi:hypothetical protein
VNKIEEYKREKDGLEYYPGGSALCGGRLEAITDGDKERLKWAGVFFRSPEKRIYLAGYGLMHTVLQPRLIHPPYFQSGQDL